MKRRNLLLTAIAALTAPTVTIKTAAASANRYARERFPIFAIIDGEHTESYATIPTPSITIPAWRTT